jgi:type I restriction enzyme M protein
MNLKLTSKEIGSLFTVTSGDFHVIRNLDPGNVPVISCGDTNNGLVGYFDIPDDMTYERALTVAYNGSWPLTTKFHPYKFAAKDDVAVLTPLTSMRDTTLFYMAATLDVQKWRYSYGRKCFREKLQQVSILVPMRNKAVDEDLIAQLCPSNLEAFWPSVKQIFAGLSSDGQLKLRLP